MTEAKKENKGTPGTRLPNAGEDGEVLYGSFFLSGKEYKVGDIVKMQSPEGENSFYVAEIVNISEGEDSDEVNGSCLYFTARWFYRKIDIRGIAETFQKEELFWSFHTDLNHVECVIGKAVVNFCWSSFPTVREMHRTPEFYCRFVYDHQENTLIRLTAHPSIFESSNHRREFHRLQNKIRPANEDRYLYSPKDKSHFDPLYFSPRNDDFPQLIQIIPKSKQSATTATAKLIVDTTETSDQKGENQDISSTNAAIPPVKIKIVVGSPNQMKQTDKITSPPRNQTTSNPSTTVEDTISEGQIPTQQQQQPKKKQTNVKVDTDFDFLSQQPPLKQQKQQQTSTNSSLPISTTTLQPSMFERSSITSNPTTKPSEIDLASMGSFNREPKPQIQIQIPTISINSPTAISPMIDDDESPVSLQHLRHQKEQKQQQEEHFIPQEMIISKSLLERILVSSNENADIIALNGFFIRVLAGVNRKTRKEVYRLAQIVSVINNVFIPYSVKESNIGGSNGSKLTNCIIIGIGNDPANQRAIKTYQISDDPPTNEEMALMKNEMSKLSHSLPSTSEMALKRKSLEKQLPKKQLIPKQK